MMEEHSMADQLHVMVCGKIKSGDFRSILRAAYAEFNGSAFAIPLEKLDNAFEKFKGGHTHWVAVDNDFPGSLVIENQKNFTGFYIYCDVWFFYYGSLLFYKDYEREGGFSEREIKKGKENFKELIDLCKLLLRHSGGSYFYAGVEAFGDIDSSCDVQFLYCKESEYSKLLQAYVKEYFKVGLGESVIKRIVEKSAEIVREGEYVLLNFMRIRKDALFPQDFFNDEVKRYLKDRGLK
jgi:hypothetical protein